MSDDPDPSDGDLSPAAVDRAFEVLTEAIEREEVGETQLERLLSVLEGALANPSETDPEALAELLSLLEALVVEPADLADVDLEGLLSVLEESVAGLTAADEAHLADVFDVVEEGLSDPSGLDPEDVERFRAGLEGAVVDVTDPTADGFGGLFPVPGLTAVDPEAADDETADLFRIARVAAAMTQRATGHSVESGVRTGTRMAYAAATADSPADLVTKARAVTLDELQRAGVDIGDSRADWLEAHEDDAVDPRPVTREALRERGERLLDRSAEVGRDETLHPAFPSILDSLAGDEARILRLLAREGRQATVDVYDKGYVPFRKRLVAEHLTMIGSDAGCRYPERTPIYLQHLESLGLVRFYEDPIADLKRYQVLEAQTHIEIAREDAKRPKTVYGSVALSDLGVHFCEVCMPFEVEAEYLTVWYRRQADAE